MQILRFLSPPMFNRVRIFLTFFWVSGINIVLGVMMFFWFVPIEPDGPFSDHPILLRLLVTVFSLGFAAIPLFCLLRLWRINPGSIPAEYLQQQQRLLQRLSKAAEPIHKHETPVVCPTCGAKFLLENSVTSAPPVCSFCGTHIPASS
ncbi:MAG: hypothetical protein ACKO2L_01525 [Planctomycetaceae bacterium]